MRPRFSCLASLAIVLTPFWASSRALAACDMPQIAPIDVPLGAEADGSRLHIVSGVVGVCDPGLRDFDVALAAATNIAHAEVRLAIAGFTRAYGVHQIGFALQSEAAEPTPTGVKIRFTGRLDGLERYQLAYTLYLTVKP